MKTNRLIGILAILLQYEKISMPVLAEKFEVSRRTINRDIEDLCMAGIPIVSTRGPRGGVSIMDGYRIDKSRLSSTELQAILAGLGSLDSVSASDQYSRLIEELSYGTDIDSHIRIDLANERKVAYSFKIGLIDSAIKNRQMISFQYYSPKGKTRRLIEPYYLTFEWKSWYVWGWCTDRQDFRLFKLVRMEKLEKGGTFEKRDLPASSLKRPEDTHGYLVRAVFDPHWEWRLREECGSDSFARQSDGHLLFSYHFSDKESIAQWILTFGKGVELLEPVELRTQLRDMGRYLQELYQN